MFILVISWIIYLALHSFLASNGCKEWVKHQIGLKGAWYRLVYTLISISGLILIGWIIDEIPQKRLLDPGIFIYAGYLLILVGIVVVLLSFRYLSGMEFIGLKKMTTENNLVTGCIHARVRHPIYTGTIAILLGYLSYQPTAVVLISVVIILLYLPIGIYFEERKLIEKFGKDYLNYKNKVPSIFPRLW